MADEIGPRHSPSPFERVVELLDEVEHDREEVEILMAGGVTVEDFDYAVGRWIDARRVRGDWGYIRTVALARRADIVRIQRSVSREL